MLDAIEGEPIPTAFGALEHRKVQGLNRPRLETQRLGTHGRYPRTMKPTTKATKATSDPTQNP